jgi:hypothetical protein
MKWVYSVSKFILSILFLSCAFISCSGGSGGSNDGDGDVVLPASIAKIAGDSQIAAPGTAVAVPPAVRVMDRFGNPVPNEIVQFSVLEGGGSVWITVAETNAAGEASCGEWTLGTAKGLNSLTATVDGLAPTMFAASVKADVLLELGHGDDITRLRMVSSRVLSQDSSGHWSLWDYASGSLIANGDSLSVDMAGPTVVISQTSGFEVRASSDGHLLSKIMSQNSWWMIASDGSYLCAGSNSSLSAWTPTGQIIVSRAGDYSNVKSYAAPDEIRVALGPNGLSVIETIDIRTGASAVGPAFAGQFHSWFNDGERFLTNVANTVWVYSKNRVQEAIFSLSTISNLTGQGGWVWTYENSTMSLYSVGGNGTPAATWYLPINAAAIASGEIIGVIFSDPPSASIIDLSGSSPSKADYVLPIAYPSSFRAASSSQWVVGNGDGVVLDGDSLSSEARYFGLGRAWSISGGADRVAVATASGKILYFDASTNTLEGVIDFSSSKLEISNDGTVLAASANALHAQYAPDRTLKVFSLPTATVSRSWPYTFQITPFLKDFSLARTGTHIGQVLATAFHGVWDFDRQVSAIQGGPPTWSDVISGSFDLDAPIRLSPDGSLIAVSSGAPDPSVGTNIFKEGILATAVTGWAVGWIDNARFLVNRYVSLRPDIIDYEGCAIYDQAGVEVAAPPLPEMTSFQTVTADLVYSPEWNAIFSLSTGETTWSSAIKPYGEGAVAGSRVVFTFGSRILLESY